MSNILAENMCRFGTKNLDLYDQLLIEGSMTAISENKTLLGFVVAGSILLGAFTGIKHEKQKNRWIAVYNKVKQLDPKSAREIDALIQNFDYSNGFTGRNSLSPLKDNQIEKKLETAIDVFVKEYDKEKPNVPDVLDLDDDGNTDELLKNTFK